MYVVLVKKTFFHFGCPPTTGKCDGHFR